jgi:hypothetical protein
LTVLDCSDTPARMAYRHVVAGLNGVTMVPSNGVLTQFLFPLQFFRHGALQGLQHFLCLRRRFSNTNSGIAPLFIKQDKHQRPD